MILTLCTLLIAGVLTAAALSAARGDIGLTRNDLDQKDAYYAAQAGISDYAFHLNQDVNYWTYCTSVPTPSAVNQIDSTTNRRPVAGSTDETYAIELLPANNTAACSTSNPIGDDDREHRLRRRHLPDQLHRLLPRRLALDRRQFRRASFLDYVYYTDYETLHRPRTPHRQTAPPPPRQCDVLLAQQPAARPATELLLPDLLHHRRLDQRPAAQRGHARDLRQPRRSAAPRQDRDRGRAPAPGHSSQGNCGCTDNPTFNGTYIAGANSLTPPPTNAQLLSDRAAGHTTSPARPRSSSTAPTMTVTNNGTHQHRTPSPATASSTSRPQLGCPITYTPFTANYTDATATGCGNVYVSGNYSSSLTIASDNDIIIDGNLTPTARRHRRRCSASSPTTSCAIYHPVTPLGTRAASAAAAGPTAPAR